MCEGRRSCVIVYRILPHISFTQSTADRDTSTHVSAPFCRPSALSLSEAS